MLQIQNDGQSLRRKRREGGLCREGELLILFLRLKIRKYI